MTYFVIQGFSIYRFADESEVINHFQFDFSSGIGISEHSVIRSDGILCSVIEPEKKDDFVKLNEEGSKVDENQLREITAALCRYLKTEFPGNTDTEGALNILYDRSKTLQKRFDTLIGAVVIALILGVGYFVFFK